VLAIQPLHRRRALSAVGVQLHRDDDGAIRGIVTRTHDHIVAIKNAILDHRVAPHQQRELLILGRRAPRVLAEIEDLTLARRGAGDRAASGDGANHRDARLARQPPAVGCAGDVREQALLFQLAQVVGDHARGAHTHGRADLAKRGRAQRTPRFALEHLHDPLG
jgi:hypothetical protein